MANFLTAAEGPLKGLILTLADREQYVLGRDKDVSDLLLEEASVSRRHALFKKTAAGYTIENLSDTNPLLVNGKPIKLPHLLKETDTIKIGENLFKYSLKEPEAASEEAEPADDDEFPENKTAKKAVGQAPSYEAAEEGGEAEEPLSEDEHLYDTIFEDRDLEEPSYPPPIQGELILRVVSGPNVGAEFNLEKNKSYVIGKDPESADIIFNDLSVSNRHCVLSIDKENNIFVEDLGSKNSTLINSKKSKGKKQLSSKDLVALGSSVFVVSGNAEKLETIYTPAPQEAEEEEEAEEQKEKTKPKVISWKKKIIPLHYLVLTSLAAVILLSMSLAFFSLFKSEKIEIVKKDYSEEIEEIVSDYKSVNFSFNPAMYKLFLTGHVLTQIEQEELLYKLKALAFIESLENNIIIDELVWKNMNDILENLSGFRSVSIRSLKAGEFVVQGYVETVNDAQKLSDFLNANFPYLEKLKNEVVIESILKIDIGSQIIFHGLSNISFELASGELILAGRYSSDETGQMHKLVKYLKNKKGIHSIKNIAIETTPDMARIDISKDYPVAGLIEKDDEEFSIVIQNKILNIGDYIDGMRLTEIKAHMIYLEKDGLKYKINYKR